MPKPSKKRTAQCYFPCSKSDNPKKSAKKQNQKVTHNCLTPDEKAEKIKLLLADRQRILDNQLEEEHSYEALCLKHIIPGAVFFLREECLYQLLRKVYFSKRCYQMLSK